VDAMKMAMKKHMGKLKGMHHESAPEGSPLEEKMESPDEEMKEKLQGDKAPELKPMHSGELGPEHLDLLKALLGQMSGHPRRGPMTLEEHAIEPMKAHVAALGKHKKI
jgi:hypothetical protein